MFAKDRWKGGDMKDNVVQTKSYASAVRVVRSCQRIGRAQHKYVLTKQLLRSGTSIAANIEEAVGAHSGSDSLRMWKNCAVSLAQYS